MKISFGNQFIFRMETTLFDSVDINTKQRWVASERVGQRPALQNVGPDTDTTSLPGSIFDCWIGDMTSMDKLYAIQKAAEPHELWTIIDGVGQPYLPGRWVISEISEQRKTLGAYGKPKQIEWVLTLLRYD